MAQWLIRDKELYTKFLNNEVDLEYLRVQYYKYINK